MRLFLLLMSYSLMAQSAAGANQAVNSSVSNLNENTWYQQGEQWLQNKVSNLQVLSSRTGNLAAKNIILVVGDGMSITTLTAARIWQGQQQGQLGEEHFLHFEHFPHTALIKTYNSNQQSPDSAGTMTAMMTGIKTRAGLINVGPEQDRSDCQGSTLHQQKSLLQWGQEANFATGIVTTARLTHATPAATYAHSPERNWEGDLMRYPSAYFHGCDSIAKQLIDEGFAAGLDVALGGGEMMLDSHYPRFKQKLPAGRLIHTEKQLLQLEQSTAPILGVFASSHMDYEIDRKRDSNTQQPSLSLMAERALLHLQKQNKRFLLVVEGARIDQAHHRGNAARALSETAMLADTVARLDELTADDDTLIIVTADHSHNFVMAGYPARGNPILAISKNQAGEEVLANDGLPYTTLGYANGDAFGRQVGSQSSAHNHSYTQDESYHQGVAVSLDAATHGSDDVALHAKGPGAYLFSGLMEQHEIFHTMMQALGVKEGAEL